MPENVEARIKQHNQERGQIYKGKTPSSLSLSRNVRYEIRALKERYEIKQLSRSKIALFGEIIGDFYI